MRRRAVVSSVVLALAAMVFVVGGRPLRAAEVVGPLPPELQEWVADHGPVRVGWPDQTEPFVVADPDGTVTGGWGVELWDLAALKLGIDVTHVLLPTPDAVQAALVAGDLDVVGGLGPRPGLAAVATPTDPIGFPPTVFVVAGSSPASALDDLAGTTATTIAGSPMEALLAERFPDVTYVRTDTIDDGMDAVRDGEIDAFLGPLATVGQRLRAEGRALRPLGEAVSLVEIAAWGLPDTPALAVAETATSVLTDAELATVHVRWTGFDLTAPDAGVPAWAMNALVASVGAAALLALFTLVLRRRVRTATTELRALNEELEGRVARRTAELELSHRAVSASNEALSQFAERVAHDLRSPITAISGLSATLLDEDVPPTVVDTALETIRRSAGRLDEMISHLLDEAMPGGPDERPDGTTLHDWLVDIVGPAVDAGGATLRVNMAPHPVDADTAALRHAIVNLVGNSLKYGASAESRILVTLTCAGPTWSLVVEDDGPGIPVDQRDEVFERGVRLVEDGEVEGSGFGLAAVRASVRGAGGSIRIDDSTTLGGTRVTVTLPTLDEDATERDLAASVVGS